MSELKEHLFCECDECIREYRGPLSNEMRPYYLKSEADKVIAELEEERRWRKFSEETPEHHQYILCYFPSAKFCKVDLRRWDEGTKFDVFEQELYTHWMHLPSAPKEEK